MKNLLLLLLFLPAPLPALASPTDASPSPTRAIEVPGYALRRVDRATVRILALRGITGDIARGRAEVPRLVARGRAAFGSGVVISRDGLVLTARHLVEGSDLLAVVFAGQRAVVPAAVVYVDPAHDIAFLALQTSAPLADFVALPTAPVPLTSGQRVAVSGYPLDPEERYPAAAAGEFSRLNNDGRIQLSISVNHGNSGGPVFDDRGQLLGVVSARGDVQQGAVGLSFVEPIGRALAAWRGDGASLPRPTFTPEDGPVAQCFYDLMRLDPTRDLRDTAVTERVLSLTNARLRPEAAAMVGAHAWNEAIGLLEASRATTVSALTADVRARVESLLGLATDQQLRAMREAPYLREHYVFPYWFARIRGAVVAPPTPPLRDDERAEGERLPPEATAPDAAPVAPTAGPIDRKLRAFLRQQLRLDAAPRSTAAARVTLRLRFNGGGSIVTGAVDAPTGDAACDGHVSARLRALVERHPRVESLTSGEAAAIADQDVLVALTVGP